MDASMRFIIFGTGFLIDEMLADSYEQRVIYGA